MNVLLDPPSRAGELLAAVHRTPGVPRAVAAAGLGLSSGLASDLVSALAGAQWLIEGEPASGGGRGRPTRTLWPHPSGPLVAVASISHERWAVEVSELGGGVLAAAGDEHRREAVAVLGAVRACLADMARRFGARLHAVAVSVPGTVTGTRLVQAPNLGWEGVELSALLPPDAPDGLVLEACNDATYSAIGELHRGVAAGVESSLHLVMDSGIGGALVDGGRVTTGASGMAGEFGHLPLGSRRRRCRCGAVGCWNTDLDGTALARALGHAVPADEVTFSRAVLAAARGGERAETRAVAGAAASLGRGIAGLVNACDPALVVLGGLAPELYEVAPGALGGAYRDGLMSTRAAAAPELVAGALGGRAPLVGAMESAFAPVLAHPAL